MKFRHWHFIFAIPMALAALLFLFCLVVRMAGQQLYLPPITSKELCPLCACFMGLWGILWAGTAWCLKSKQWYRLIGKGALILAIMAVIAIVALASLVFGTGDSTYQRFDSPDGVYSLVIENERFFPDLERGTVYIMTSRVTMKEVSQFDENFLPEFNQVRWYDSYVDIILWEETIRIPLDSPQ